MASDRPRDYRAAMLTTSELIQELRAMETAPAVEMDQPVMLEHLALARAALHAGCFVKLPPLLSAEQLQDLWEEYQEGQVVQMDGDLFRDILLQALAASPVMQ